MIKFGSILFRTEHTMKDYESVRRVAIESEKLGFDSVWLCDHFNPCHAPPHEPVLEAWTTLSALSSQTTRVRLGTLVLCNSYRYPQVLAKMASTLDVISNGRLEFGIGAGWYESEYEAYGIPFPKVSIRIKQLREAIQVIKKMWTEDEATFTGDYYRLKNAICDPKPVQQPHPPIWVAGLGEKLTLRIVAEFANGCNFWGVTPLQYKHKLHVLKQYCENIGRNSDDIQKSWSGVILITKDERELKARIHEFRACGLLSEEPDQNYLIGTAEDCLKRLKEYVDVGVTYFILNFMDVWESEPLQLFADNIISALRRK